LGAGLYNKITKALKQDPELKARYMTILETVSSARASAEATEEEPEEEQ